MKVLHVLGRLDVGGAETMLLALCRAMPRTEFSQAIAVLSGRSGALTPDFEASGIQEIPLPLHPAHSFPLRLFRTLRMRRPDVVVSHVSLVSGVVLSVARLAGVKRRVAFFHSDGDGRGNGLGRRAFRGVMRILLRINATEMAGVTSTTLAFGAVRGMVPPRARVVANGVDLERFAPKPVSPARDHLGLPGTALVVMHAGRDAPEKNRSSLPGILRQLPAGTHLVLAGGRAADDLGLDDSDPLWERIHDFGVVRDLAPLLVASDVFVLPSVREGFPMVILEALSCGKPVVASDLPSLRHVAARLPDVALVRGGRAADFAAAILWAYDARRPADDVRMTLATTGMDLPGMAERWSRLCKGVP